MNVSFKPTFVKDFKDLPEEIKRKIKKVCLEILPKLDNLQNLKDYNIKNLKGFRNYYRIKLGEYRIGFKKENHSVVFMRVKHRKDIYRYFP